LTKIITINENPRKISNERSRFGRTFVIRMELFVNPVDPTNGNSLPALSVPRISSPESLIFVDRFVGTEIEKSLFINPCRTELGRQREQYGL